MKVAGESGHARVGSAGPGVTLSLLVSAYLGKGERQCRQGSALAYVTRCLLSTASSKKCSVNVGCVDKDLMHG